MEQDKIPYQELCFDGNKIVCQKDSSTQTEEVQVLFPSGTTEERLLISPYCFYIGYLDAVHGLNQEKWIPTLIEIAEQSFPVSFSLEQKKVLEKHYSLGYQEGLALLEIERGHAPCDYSEVINNFPEALPEEVKTQICNIFSSYPDFQNLKNDQKLRK